MAFYMCEGAFSWGWKTKTKLVFVTLNNRACCVFGPGAFPMQFQKIAPVKRYSSLSQMAFELNMCHKPLSCHCTHVYYCFCVDKPVVAGCWPVGTAQMCGHGGEGELQGVVRTRVLWRCPPGYLSC